MDTVPLDVAFARFGADVSGMQRPRFACAADGSLVLVCESTGFSRPAAGVLRFSGMVSVITAGRAHLAALREQLGLALADSRLVHLIIETRNDSRAARRVHLRRDLVGTVTGFDGDAYSVDFRRPPVEEPPAPPRGRRGR